MSEAVFQLDKSAASYQPQERISGSVTFQSPMLPQSGEIRLFWYTEGKGDRDVTIVERFVLPEPISSSASFSFTVPDGPYSFSGQLISLIWALEFVGKSPKVSCRETIVVGPEAQAVTLGVW